MKYPITTILCLMVLGLSGQDLVVVDQPDWAMYRDTTVTSTIDLYTANSGYYFTNYNVLKDHASKTTFFHTKSKILNSSGVNALSQVNIEFDTAYQSVQIHTVKIHRNDEIYDRTADVKFNIINNESGLGANVYRGIMMANAVLNDIRKHDIIEMAYSIIGANPLYEDHLHEVEYLQGFTHIDHLSYKLITSSKNNYSYKIKNDDGLIASSYSETDKEYLEIEGFNIAPPKLEESMSASSMPFNFVEISSFSDWKEVNKWAMNLFNEKSSSILDEAYMSNRGKDDDPIKRATSLLDYVQNGIRYTSINGGIGSLKASPPEEVIQRNYGDCKDKSLLFIHLAKKMGIQEVYPALVNSSSGKRLNEYLPGFAFFDHVIVKCIIDGKPIWIDPTLSLQGGSIINRLSYDYGYALVVDGEGSELQKMQVQDDYSNLELTEIFDFKDVNKDGILEVRTVFKGKKADMIRSLFDLYSPREIADLYKEAYSKIFLNVSSIKNLQYEDDYQNNVFTLNEYYSIHDVWQTVEKGLYKSHSFNYEPMNLYSYLVPTSCDSIHYSIDLEETSRYSQKTIFKLPEDSVYRLEDIETENKAYRFKKKHKVINLSESEINYEFEILADEVRPEDYYEVCQDINKNCRSLALSVFWMSKE